MEGRTTESMKDVQRTVASLGGGANERNANHRLDDVEEEEAVSRAPQLKRARHVNVRLHELSRNFCEMIKILGRINLNSAATTLNVPKRRLYDITNVLEGIGYITKVSCNQYVLSGGEHDSSDHSRETGKLERQARQALEEEVKLDVWIQKLKELQQKSNDTKYVLAQDIVSALTPNEDLEEGESSEKQQQQQQHVKADKDGSTFAIHAPNGSLIQVSTITEESSSSSPLQQVFETKTACRQSPPPSGKYQLLVSSTGTDLDRIKNRKRKKPSTIGRVEVYTVPKSGGPAKALIDDPMFNLLFPAAESPPTLTSEYANYSVLKPDEGASSFF